MSEDKDLTHTLTIALLLSLQQAVLDERACADIALRNRPPARKIAGLTPLTDILDRQSGPQTQRAVDYYYLDMYFQKAHTAPDRSDWLAYHRMVIIKDNTHLAELNRLSESFDTAFAAFPGAQKAILLPESQKLSAASDYHIRLRSDWWNVFMMHRWTWENEADEPFNKQVVLHLAKAFKMEKKDFITALGFLDLLLSRKFSGYDETVRWFFAR